MDIIQSFYNNLASQYDKLFADWRLETHQQGAVLDKLFKKYGYSSGASLLDCACGIGTQSVGLAALGYCVTASDICQPELDQALQRAKNANVSIDLRAADFRELEKTFSQQFDIVICMDNALPHMLSANDLQKAIKSIADRVKKEGIFVASIRDYDALLETKPPYSPPYIHKTEKGQRVSFQTWEWIGEKYKLIQYIVDDEESLSVSKFECEYRATRRDELTKLLLDSGFGEVDWLFPEESGFYQPIVIAKK